MLFSVFLKYLCVFTPLYCGILIQADNLERSEHYLKRIYTIQHPRDSTLPNFMRLSFICHVSRGISFMKIKSPFYKPVMTFWHVYLTRYPCSNLIIKQHMKKCLLVSKVKINTLRFFFFFFIKWGNMNLFQFFLLALDTTKFKFYKIHFLPCRISVMSNKITINNMTIPFPRRVYRNVWVPQVSYRNPINFR